MSSQCFGGRDYVRFIFCWILGPLVGWFLGLISYVALDDAAELSDILPLLVVLVLIGLPTLTIQLPISMFIHRRQQAAIERMSEDEKRHDALVTGLCRKFL